MAKRFIETSFFKDPFVRGLKGAYKGLYIYLFLDCSNAGIWNVELDVAKLRCGIDPSVSEEEIKKVFSDKIIPLENGEKWFLKNYLKVQHNGLLKRNNKAHISAIEELLKYGIVDEISEGEFQISDEVFKGLPRGLQDPRVMVKVKEEGNGNGNGNGKKEYSKKNENEITVWPDFDDFWEAYDKKIGSRSKLKKKWDKINQSDKEKIMAYIPNYKLSQPDKSFRKNPETFFNNESWNDEIILKSDEKKRSNTNQSGASEEFRRKTAERLGII